MKVHLKHGKVTQSMHGASRNYRYVWDVSVSNFGKSINDNEDGIISFLGFWKTSDEFHTNFVQFLLGNRQRLKSTSRSLMFCLNATINMSGPRVSVCNSSHDAITWIP